MTESERLTQALLNHAFFLEMLAGVLFMLGLLMIAVGVFIWFRKD